jgi:Family of unknown function (DUF6130)
MKIKNHGLQWLLAASLSLIYWFQGGLALANVGLSETAPPPVIAQLATAASGSPQIAVVSPHPDEVVSTNNVLVYLQVQGVPVFKNAALGLGPHVHVLLDRAPYQSVYDLAQPLTLTNLTPGTHTLQVLMAKPWHESWKNPGAFAQVTFHVFAKSAENSQSIAPTLVYNEPDATYGAEPFLLDFYLANAPSHRDARQQLVNDWRVRTTINDQSFEVDQMSPFYLKGLKPGANLVKLEYLNAQGQSLDSVLRVVNYQPQGTDTLSRLLRNELVLTDALALFDPNSKDVIVATTARANVAINSGVPIAVTPQALVPPVKVAPPIAIPTVASTAVATMTTPPSIAPIPTPVISPTPIVVIPATPVPVIAPPAPLAPIPASQPLTTALNPGTNLSVKPLPLPSLPSALSPQLAAPTKSVLPSSPPLAKKPALIQPSQSPVAVAPVLPTPTFSSNSVKNPGVIVPNTPSNSVAAGFPPATVTPPSLLTPKTGENTIEFKVLAKEFFHTLSVRIKQFTNSIPPKVARWSKNVSHWIGDRSQAMQTGQKAIAPEKS